MDFKLNPLFILMLGVTFFTGYAQEALIIVAVVALHELAHALAARILDVEVVSLELLPFGAAATLSSAPMKVGDEIFVALAGPAANILSMMLAISLKHVLPGFFQLDPTFVRYSAALAVFNLFPALPLDGGRILRAILTPHIGMARATKSACVAGYILAAVLVGFGIFMIIYEGWFNFTLFVIGVFVFISAFKERKTVHYRAMRDKMNKFDKLSKEGALPIRNIAVYYNTPVSKLLLMRSPGVVNVFSVMDENLRVMGSIGEGELMSVGQKDEVLAGQLIGFRVADV